VFIEDQKTGVDAVRDRLLVPLGNVTSTQGGSKVSPARVIAPNRAGASARRPGQRCLSQ
jgi:hypothetical protein